MEVAIVGAGQMGAALALALDRSGNAVSILGTRFDAPFIDAMASGEPHPGLGLLVPPRISVVDEPQWEKGLTDCKVVVIAVASVGVRDVSRMIAPLISPDAVLAVASKGWDPDSALPLSQVIESEVPGHSIVVVVGPSLARELAAGAPTGLVCASTNIEAASSVAHLFSGSGVRAFVSDDVVGVEVGAALKNVLAIAVGMCDGVSEATGRELANTKAALFSRGLVEMARLAKALGGRHDTVLGLAGAGDLFVTILGGRNGRFGRLLGAGVDPKLALEEMGTTVEGVENAKEAKLLAERHGLDLTVVNLVHSVLYENATPELAIETLVLGPVEHEI